MAPSCQTLLQIMKDKTLPYDIRSVTTKLLHELFLETPGALTVLHDERVELVARVERSAVQLGP